MTGTPIRISTAARLMELSRTHIERFIKAGKLALVPTGDGTMLVTLESVQKLRVERDAAKKE